MILLFLLLFVIGAALIFLGGFLMFIGYSARNDMMGSCILYAPGIVGIVFGIFILNIAYMVAPFKLIWI